MLFIRVNSLVIEHDTILSALSRSKNDTELLMMQLTLHSECSTLETELNTEMHWQAKYLKGFVGQYSVYGVSSAHLRKNSIGA